MLDKHQQKTLATKAKLFEAAQRVFASCGFERATIDQIARRAGFIRGAFYAHFKNKEDLFFGLLQQGASKRLVQLRSQLQAGTEEQSRVSLESYARAAFATRNGSLLQIGFKQYIARRAANGVKAAAKPQSVQQNSRRNAAGTGQPTVIRRRWVKLAVVCAASRITRFFGPG